MGDKIDWSDPEVVEQVIGIPDIDKVEGFIVDVKKNTKKIIQNLNISGTLTDYSYEIYDGNILIGIIIFNESNNNYIDFVGTINGEVSDIEDKNCKNTFNSLFDVENRKKYGEYSGIGRKLFELYLSKLDKGTSISLTSLNNSYGFYEKIFKELESKGVIKILKDSGKDFIIEKQN